MKSFIAIIAVLIAIIAVVLSLLTMPVTMPVGNVVLAASTTSVVATVKVQNISVSVGDGTVAYGTLGLNATTSTITLSDTQNATNTGNVAENFNVMGSTSTNWTLAGTAGNEAYVHKFCTSTCATPPTNYTALTTSYITAKTNIAANATTSLDLMINTPNATIYFTEQSLNVTVQAVAYP